jgi:DMSO/TMAO reductase YedYZ heme-binding membrane subunit
VATTRSRPRGRESARPSSGGVVAEHASKIYGTAIASLIVIVAFLTMTKIGHVVDAATQHFMLYYAGVFALIALCTSTGLGLISTDRLVLSPGHRIFVQSMHRAASFGALAFLVIHIVTEILAQRVHVIDAFIPFLSPFKTFYIGLGTIASDLIVLIVITSIFRKRFTVDGKAWSWRAIHYTAYVAFVFGIWHGLLGGRPGKPYVDWSYGFVIAFTALGLAVRVLANSLRPKENLSRPPVDDTVGTASSPLRAATLSMASQFGGATRMLPATGGMTATVEGILPARGAAQGVYGAGPASGPMPALAALPAGAGADSYTDYPGPPGGRDRQPLYEPGYEGPPRYAGAPRRDNVPGYGDDPGYGDAGYGEYAGYADGPGYEDGPGYAGGPGYRDGPDYGGAPGYGGPSGYQGMRRYETWGDEPPARPAISSGRPPRAATGPMPRAGSGPMPRAGTGPMPRAGTGPMPRAATGPMPRAGTGPMPRAGSGPMPRAGTGPMPRAGTGPMPRAGSGPVPRAGTGPMPRAATGPMPRAGSGPMPRAATGPMPRAGDRAPGTGPTPRPGTGPMPRVGGGPGSQPGPGPAPRAGTGRPSGTGTGPMPRAGEGPMPGPARRSRPGRRYRGPDPGSSGNPPYGPRGGDGRR